jgi:hypothetical protein
MGGTQTQFDPSAAYAGMPTGMQVSGNINLNNRPILHNPDGTISSELSFSRGTDKGEVLVPQIVNGQKLTQDAAWQHYLDTGEHMGIFDSPQHADDYAQNVHARTLNTSKSPMYMLNAPQAGSFDPTASYSPATAKPNSPNTLGDMADVALQGLKGIAQISAPGIAASLINKTAPGLAAKMQQIPYIGPAMQQAAPLKNIPGMATAAMAEPLAEGMQAGDVMPDPNAPRPQPQGGAISGVRKILPAPEQEALVRGALISNIQAGEDKAIQSIKALGSTRDLGMFQPEMQTGVVIISVPQSAIANKAEILNAPEEN